MADAVAKYGANVPIIADGGIRGSGDVAIALIAGASAVMIGNLFARCRESPGTLITIGGRYYKQYRGMGAERRLQIGGRAAGDRGSRTPTWAGER